MYDFLYNYIKKTYGSSAAWPKAGDRAKLLFTDTNSLLYEIATEDFYKDISGDVEDKLDTSSHGVTHCARCRLVCYIVPPRMHTVV